MASFPLSSGDREQATKTFEKALTLDPAHVDSLTGLGKLLVEREEHDMALNRLTNALERHPTDHEVR